MHRIFMVLMLVGCPAKDKPSNTDTTNTTGTSTTGTTTTTTATITGDSPLVFTDGVVPKNLLMISIDTLRRDHVDSFGTKGLTPFLGGLVDQGLRVDDFRACSNYTFHATTCVALGRYALEGAEDFGALPQMGPNTGPLEQIPAGVTLMPHYLRDLGFYTMFVTANNMYGEGNGNGAGYDNYFETIQPDAIQNIAIAPTMIENQRASGDLGADQPWFMHVHVIDPHSPYDPPDSYLGRLQGLPVPGYDLATRAGQTEALAAMRDGAPQPEADNISAQLIIRYEEDVRWLDDKLEVAWANLESQGLLDDTLVVFWSDHGEQQFERGGWAHGQALNADENDVILFFWSKNMEPGVHTEPVVAIDVLPTLINLYGGQQPSEVTGLPLGAAPADRVIYSTALAKAGAIATASIGTKKLIFAWDEDPPVLPYSYLYQAYGLQYFDRSTDRTEMTDLYDAADPDVLELWGHLKPWVQRVEPFSEYYTATFPAELP